MAAAARRLAVERGHLGITNELVRAEARCDSTRAGTVLAKLTRSGEIHGAVVEGLRKHWFASAELAQRWLATTAPQPKPEPTPRPAVVQHRARLAPVQVAPRRDSTDTPAIVPAHVRVQRLAAATHDPRYQCAPGERPAGAGFAAAGIGRDVTTGTAWGPRA